jgi:hypothetical protein
MTATLTIAMIMIATVAEKTETRMIFLRSGTAVFQRMPTGIERTTPRQHFYRPRRHCNNLLSRSDPTSKLQFAYSVLVNQAVFCGESQFANTLAAFSNVFTLHSPTMYAKDLAGRVHSQGMSAMQPTYDTAVTANTHHHHTRKLLRSFPSF